MSLAERNSYSLRRGYCDFSFKQLLLVFLVHMSGHSGDADGSSDRFFMVDPLSYFLFQPVLHNWCKNGCGMCYLVCGMIHINEPLLLIEKSSHCLTQYN